MDTFRNTTPAVNQELVRKSQKQPQGLIFENLTRQPCLFKLRHFAAQSLSLISEQRENEQVPTSLIQKLVNHTCLFSLRHFPAQCFRSLQSKQAETEQVPAKKGHFQSSSLDD